MEEFIAEEILALADIGLCCKDANGILAVEFTREITLARPDRQHDAARHAELFFDACESVAILRCELPSTRSKTIKARLPQILRRRLHEFRLLRLLLGTAGDGEIG